MMFELKEKVVLVTGGLGGMGLEIVKAFLKENVAGVAVLDISNQERENLLKIVAKNHTEKVLYISTDITNSAEVEKAFKTTVNKFGKLDVVVNTVAILDEKNWKKCINVNLIGVMEISLLAIEKYFPKYCKENEAVIVNIASIAAFMAFAPCPTYATTKAGLVGFARSIGEKLKLDISKQIKIITVCPGATNTPLMKSASIEDEVIAQILASMKIQEPSYIGSSLIDLVKTAENGSVWVMEDNETYELEFQTYIEMKKKN